MTFLVLGYGYTARACVAALATRHARIVATTRSAEKARALEQAGLTALVFDGRAAGRELVDALADAETIIASIPPDENGDPALAAIRTAEIGTPKLSHVLYLSTIGVYGDAAGGWVDETTPAASTSERGQRRVRAEQDWLVFGEERGVSVQILRLGGIYGPGRNALLDLSGGVARRIIKPGQVFNRIHVDDIARVAVAALDRGGPGAIWNVVDDEPAPPQDVISYAAELLGVPAPREIPFAEAELSPMGRAFYADNKRVSNRAIREKLGVKLAYPTYRQGLGALLAAGEGRNGRPSERQKARR